MPKWAIVLLVESSRGEVAVTQLGPFDSIDLAQRAEYTLSQFYNSPGRQDDPPLPALIASIIQLSE